MGGRQQPKVYSFGARHPTFEALWEILVSGPIWKVMVWDWGPKANLWSIEAVALSAQHGYLHMVKGANSRPRISCVYQVMKEP